MIKFLENQTNKLILFKGLAGRCFVGIDSEENYLEQSKRRKIEIENPEIQNQILENMNGFNRKDELTKYLHLEKEKK